MEDLKRRVEEFIGRVENQEVASADEGQCRKLLKEVWVAFCEYAPAMNEYFNGYAQAQADGAQTPLSDNDLQICIEMQRSIIKELTNQEAKLAVLLKSVLNSDMSAMAEDEGRVNETLESIRAELGIANKGEV